MLYILYILQKWELLSFGGTFLNLDLEPPQHTDWEPVAAPRRRKGKGSGASPPRDA